MRLLQLVLLLLMRTGCTLYSLPEATYTHCRACACSQGQVLLVVGGGPDAAAAARLHRCVRQVTPLCQSYSVITARAPMPAHHLYLLVPMSVHEQPRICTVVDVQRSGTDRSNNVCVTGAMP